MEEVKEDKEPRGPSNPFIEAFNSKRARGIVLLWSVSLYAISHIGYIMEPTEALMFGIGVSTAFFAWMADMDTSEM